MNQTSLVVLALQVGVLFSSVLLLFANVTTAKKIAKDTEEGKELTEKLIASNNKLHARLVSMWREDK